MLIGRPCRAIGVALSGPVLAAVPVAPTPIGVAAIPWEEARRVARTGWREAKVMSTRDNDPLHAAIDARLASLVANRPTPPAWAGPWRRLGTESGDDERLAVYRAIRSSGSLPEDAGFYLVSWQIDALADRHAEQALRHIDDQLEALEQAHGVDEGVAWGPGEAPPEYAAVLRRYHDAWDAIFAEQLEQYGEADMARLFREDPEEFRRRSEAGRLFFHEPRRPGSEVPAWLDELVEAVADRLTADGPTGPLGFCYGEEEWFLGAGSSTRLRSSCWAGRTTAPWWPRASRLVLSHYSTVRGRGPPLHRLPSSSVEACPNRRQIVIQPGSPSCFLPGSHPSLASSR